MESKEKAFFVARLILDKKGNDVVVLDLTNISGITDFFIICTGTTPTQRRAIQRTIEEEMSKLGYRPRGIEGREGSGWLLLDYYDFIVHIFSPKAREFYKIEELYKNAPQYTEF
ncbi:MAG: ribosome silencing factor [Dictyoglomaceae bacterium]